MTKRDYDVARAKELPVDFDADPPKEWVDAVEDEIVTESKGLVVKKAQAQRAGTFLASMTKQDIDDLYAALSPVSQKVRWYRTRYNQMQDKIWYLTDETERLVESNLKLRQKIEEMGGKA